MTSFSQLQSPYPGLRPFQKQEWSIFFGREPMIDNVLDELAKRQLVFVHGSSGCGKSSLILAGVLPRLEQEHSLHGIGWRTATMRPGSSPLWNLASAIARIVENGDDYAEPSLSTTRTIRKLLNSGVEALFRVQKQFDLGRNCNVCLLVDQFEELFRYFREIGQEEVETFIDVLKGFELNQESTEKPVQGIYAIVTMRSDHLGDCGHFVGFAELVNATQYLLPRISDEGLIRAIREPARLFGGDVSVPLIIRLVEESRAEIDALPLVQHALMRLWQKATVAQSSPKSRVTAVPILDEAEYRGLHRVLSDHADEVLMELREGNPKLEMTTQYLFRAISEIDGEGRGIRRPQRLAELIRIVGGNEELLEKVIGRFSRPDCGFLFRATGDNPVIDISHEALLRCWSKLNNPGIDPFTGLPTGWIYREKADGDKWRAALLMIGRRPSFRRKYRLRLIFDRKWFKQLPGKDWAERYGGRWRDVYSVVSLRRRWAILMTIIFFVYFGLSIYFTFPP